MSNGAETVLQFKGRMITVTILRLLAPGPEAVAAALDERFRDAPGLLSGLPTVLDLEALGEAPSGLDLKALQDLLRARGVPLIGLRDSGEAVRRLAAVGGLPVLKLDGGREVPRQESGSAARTASQAPTGSSQTLVVTQPVRSGQQVYARGGDLVLTAAVSAGAEVLADGHIHAYGPLRGRAMAGVVGDTGARIFCRRLDCEMVAIAGRYRLSEQITDAEREGPVQVRLEGDSLVIERL
ncbi:septum site-determining protein MinC [Thioalkalivibrio denitrificans]|uniref:Probable septum site-determining protein MinC n=1 Tax=Thioalkalivibrio denitrificans TaxID=108003 RepID=A0A1V3NV56_9GAMM|nr:septum site-determining protein MinC [Thioalkalivibrio denitrificans]OOG28682.1 septum site-determining protein MinC [Thioalkalivibrio denitrificans]